MRNVLRLAAGDFKRLFSNIVSIIIVLGLVLLPSIFTWYNVLACWDVFGNTGNLKVAVANSDEGYQSDLVPLKVNIGDQVVSALRANDQMNWVFTNEEDAVDGAEAGRYYAAVVIPQSFSRDMMTFYSGDVEHARIVYYSNEKKNAIAPKVTGQGADQISAQVNRVFAETLSETALGISQALLDYMDDTDAGGALGKLAGSIGDIGCQMTTAADALRLHARVLGSARTLIEGSGGLLAQAGTLADEAASSSETARAAAGSVADAMDGAADALSTALRQGSEGFAAVPDALDAAFASASTTAADAAAQLRASATAAQDQGAAFRSAASQLREIAAVLPQESRPAVEAMADQLDASADLADQLGSSLSGAADAVEAGDADAQAKRDEAVSLAQQARDSLQDIRVDYDADIAPTLERLSDDVGSVASSLPAMAAALQSAGDDLSSAAGSMAQRLGDAEQALLSAADELADSGAELSDLSRRIDEALATGDSQALRQVIGQDPSALAQALSAPVQLDRHAVYPVNSFGSAMAPLYTTLALWIGALLVMVALKVAPCERALAELDDPRPWQLFAGRFVVVAALSLLQSTCIGLGNLLFLGVQAVEPALYLLCLWGSGLVFAFIIYALVASFANFGKALSVMLLIIQVSGGGGSYPLALLPDFFQAASPALPITHAVNAMRAAMFGVYQADFWIEMGVLVLFALPFVLLGFVLRNPLIKIVDRFVEKVESTKVM